MFILFLSVQISQKCQNVYVTIPTAALLTMVPRHFKNNQQDREQTADQNTELARTPVYSVTSRKSRSFSILYVFRDCFTRMTP